jgi:hypothetical protein
MTTASTNRPDWGFRIDKSTASLADVSVTIGRLASAIEIMADEAGFSDLFSNDQRICAIRGIAKCLAELNAEMPEMLDKLPPMRG